MLFRLKLNRKIAMATHNIMAYRIFDENRKVLIHDCDNDGEMTAGSQLLRMLEVRTYVSMFHVSLVMLYHSMSE